MHTHTLHVFTHIHPRARVYTRIHTYTRTYTHIHTLMWYVCTRVLEPTSITPNMVDTSGTADPLNVIFSITYVSTVKLLEDNVGFNNVTYHTLQLDTTTRSTGRKRSLVIHVLV